MPNVTLSIPHQLPRAEAKGRVQEQVAQVQRQYSQMLGHVEERWNGDTMDFKLVVTGVTLTGQVFVEDRAVRVELELPWPLSMLAGGVKRQIEQKGRKLLGH